MVPRYIYPTLPMVALFSVAAVVTLFSTVRPLFVTLAASSAFLIVLWVFLLPTIAAS